MNPGVKRVETQRGQDIVRPACLGSRLHQSQVEDGIAAFIHRYIHVENERP